MLNDTGSLFSLRELLEMLFRHKKKLVIIPVLVMLAAACVMLLAPRTYRSEAKLYLQLGRASVGLDPTATTGQTINYSQSGRDEEVKSAIEIITGEGVLSRVVDELGCDFILDNGSDSESEDSFFQKYVKRPVNQGIAFIKEIDPVSDRERAMLEMRDSLSVDAERESTVLRLHYDASSPELARRILACIVDVYRQEHSRVHSKSQSLDFFDAQRVILRKQLDESETALRDAKNIMGIASVATRRESLETQLKQLRLDEFQTEQEIASASARIALVENQLSTVPERRIALRKKIPNVGADLMREQLYALQVRQKELQSRYTADHPQVVAINDQLRDSSRVVQDEESEREETSDEINPIHQSLSLELTQQQSVLAGLKSRLATVKLHMDQLQPQVFKLNEFDVQVSQLERECQLRREKFFKYSQNVEEARIDQQLNKQQISDVSVVHEATTAEKPISPSKALILAGTLLLCSAGTAATIFASDRMDTRVRAGRGLDELLGVPLLGVIPDAAAYSQVQFKSR